MQIDNQIASHRWRLRRANSYHIPDGTQGAPRVRSISYTRPLVAPRHTAAMIGCRLTPSDFVVFCDCSFQIIVFLTGDEADSLQGGEMLFCFGEIASHQVCFAEVFVRTAMSRVKGQRPLVM